MLSFTFNLYCDYILSIKRGNGIHGKSRAKPLFILSIIECISLNLLKQNQIKWDDPCLVYLYNQLSNEYDDSNKSSMIVPYYHISSSSFYHLIWKRKERPAISGHTPSGKYLRENLLYAKLDDELWDLLQDAKNREILKQKIINNYLTNK
jgi:predicted restriction endonuclease